MVDQEECDLMLGWCCMATQGGTGTNASSSLLSFETPAVLGALVHLHILAHACLEHMLRAGAPMNIMGEGSVAPTSSHTHAGALEPGKLNLSVMAQITAAVMAVLHGGVAGEHTPQHASGGKKGGWKTL